jgi:peptide deformylase
MILPIKIYGDHILRVKCTDVPRDYDIKGLIQNMRDTLATTESGVGIAAPQVGIPLRVFLGPNNMEFINFEIISLRGLKKVTYEGCLSIPGLRGGVTRHQKVRIKWYDSDWNLHEQTFKKFPAVLIQHEADHTDGVLYIDKMDDQAERKSLDDRLNALAGLEPAVAPKPYVEPKTFMTDWVELEEYNSKYEPNVGGMISVDTRDFHVTASLAEELKEVKFTEPDIDDSEYMTFDEVRERLMDWRTNASKHGHTRCHINYISDNGKHSYWYKYIRIHRVEKGYIWCDRDSNFNSAAELEKHITFKINW